MHVSILACGRVHITSDIDCAPETHPGYVYIFSSSRDSTALQTEIFIDSDVETYSSVPRFTRLNTIPPEQRNASRVRLNGNRNQNAVDSDDEDDSDEEETLTAEDLARRTDGKFQTHFTPLVSSGIPVSGFVRITAPAGRVIPHQGIKAVLESSLYAIEGLATRDLYGEEITICGPGELIGTVDLPFAFLNPANTPLSESYEGELFSIRHKIILNVERPWYTFNVASEAPIAVQTVHALPTGALGHSASSPGKQHSGSSKGGANDSSNSINNGSMTPAAVTPLPSNLSKDGSIFGQQSLPLDNLEAGASVVLKFDKGCYELSETLRGTIACSGLQKPVLLLKLAIVRIEYADGEASDSVVFDDSIMDARRWKARKDRVKLIAKMKKEHEKRSLLAAKLAAQAAQGGDGGDGAGAAPISVDVEGGVDEAGEQEEEEDEETMWMPAPEEFDAASPDPDLPILGDVNLTVDLNLGQLKMTPTYVIDVSEEDSPAAAAPGAGGAGSGGAAGGKAGKAAAKAAKQQSDDDDEDADKVTVRYFVRLTAYTAFTADARRWNAHEIVMYRGQLYGQDVPTFRLPRLLMGQANDDGTDGSGLDGSVPATSASAATSSSATASCVPGTGHGASQQQQPQSGFNLPAPLTSGLRLLGLGGSDASSGAASSNKRFGKLEPHTSSVDLHNPTGGAALSSITVSSHGRFDAESGHAADESLHLASMLTKAVVVTPAGAGGTGLHVGVGGGAGHSAVAVPTLTEEDAGLLRGGRR